MSAVLTLGVFSATAATATKTATGTDLTGATAGVWSGGGGANGSPTNTDIASWNATSLGAGLTLAAPRTWAGISVSGAATDLAITGAGPLTNGASGINLSVSTNNVSIINPVVLGANQNWSENAGVALALWGVVSGGFGLTNNATTAAVNSLAYGAYLPATTTSNLLFTSVSLTNVIGAGGMVGGAYVNGAPLPGTAYFFTNNGTTATYQLQTVDGANTKCVKVQLNQAGGNIYGTALYARYVAGASLGNNFDTNYNAGTIATSPAAAGYGAALTTLQLSTPVTTPGMLYLNGLNTFSGGLTVNSGMVLLDIGVAYNGGAGCIGSGPLTVGTGGTVNTLAAFAIGGNAGNQTVNVNGGTLNVGKADYFKALNLTGGTVNLNLSGGDRLRPVNASGAGGSINSLASATLATIASTGGGLGVDVGPLTFNTAKGSVPGGIDLLVSSPINQNGGGGGAYAVTKTGAGTLALSGANTYTGATTVSNGTMLVNSPGSLAAGTAVTVQSGAVLGGNGVINGSVTLNSGATLAAAVGTSNVGTLTINGALTMNAGSTNFLRISKTGGTPTNDVIKDLSGLAYLGTLVVSNITSDSTPLAAGDSFPIFSGIYSGGFSTVILPGLPAGYSWDLSQLSINGSITVANTAPQPIFSPAPGGYVGAQTVAVSSTISGATIYYTTNGSPPTAGSPVYSTPIAVPLGATITIKAYAHASGYADSPVVTAVFSTLPWATWTNNATTGSWAQAANWSNNVVGNGSGSLADFSTVTLTGNTTVTLDSLPTVGNLFFADQGNTYNWTISNGTGGFLTLQSPAGISTINVSNTAATVSVVLAGTNTLVTTGNGTLTLAGANTFGGGLTVSNGTLQLAKNAGYGADASAAGSGQLTIASGAAAATTVPFGISGKYGAGNTRVVNISGTLSLAASEYVRTWSLTGGTLNAPTAATDYLRASADGLAINSKACLATATVTGNLDLTYSSLVVNTEAGAGTNDLVVSGNISEDTGAGSGSKTLTKTGPGTLVLSGNNTYSGATTVSNGTLLVNSPGMLSSTSVVTVVSGAVLGGNGIINGPVNLNRGGTLVAGANNLNAGTNGSVGTLTINNQLTLNAGSTNFMRVSKNGGSPACDQVTGLTGTLTYAGTLVISNITTDGSPFSAGDSFPLFSKSSGAYAGEFSTLVFPALASGLSWDVSQLTVNGTVAIVNAVATPTFTPTAGGYLGAQSVTISCVTPGATIYYTTDGSTPTPSSPVYSAPITVPVNVNVTIQAYAVAAGYSDSAVATANFVTETAAVWTATGGGSWTANYNWTNNIIPDASGVTADFSTLTLSTDTTVTLDGAQTVGNLVFGDLGTNYNWYLAAGSGGPLTLAGGTPTVSVLNQTATLGAVVAGTNGLTKNAAGTLVLTNVNTYTGNTVVNGGTLKVDGSAIASSTAALASATISNSATVVFYRNAAGYTPVPALSGAGDFYVDSLGGGTIYDNRIIFRGTNSDNTGTIWVTNAGKLWVDRTGAAVGPSSIVNVGPSAQFYIYEGVTETIGGLAGAGNVYGGDASTAISALIVGGGDQTANFSGGMHNGTGGNILTLTKIGAGTQTLGGTNTYTGATVVSNGTLLVNGSLADGSTVTVAGGTLGGNGTVGGAVAVNGTLSPGTNGIGTLTIGGPLTLGANSTNTFAVNGSTAANTAVVLNSGVTYGGTLNIAAYGTFSAGQTFALFSGAGAASASNFARISGSPGGNLNFIFTNGVLSVAAPVVTPVTITNHVSGSTLTLSWPAGQGWRLVSQTNSLSTGLNPNPSAWNTVAGVSGNSATIIIDPSQPAVFYQLVNP